MSTGTSLTRQLPTWLNHVWQRDYCPGLDPHIAWLRQPIGWIALATSASILLGFTIAPVAISIAAGLVSLMIIGLAYPWLAVRLAACEIVSQPAELSEDDACEVRILVRNRCPWPLWGLIVEGFVVTPIDDDEALDGPTGDVALSPVPWLSSATYNVTLRPRLRGRYPARPPQLTCAFPFGLWTARREFTNASRVNVRPRVIPLASSQEQTGRQAHTSGHGLRSGGHGDFLGLRDYRLGDSIRHIHWAHTARLDSLVVCERSAAEQLPWRIKLDTSNSQLGSLVARENLAWRVRLAASLCALLDRQSIPFLLQILAEENWNTISSTTRQLHRDTALDRALERLTDVPLDGVPDADARWDSLPLSSGHADIIIEAIVGEDRVNVDHNLIRLRFNCAAANWRQSSEAIELIVNLDEPVGYQINAWLQRICHGRRAA